MRFVLGSHPLVCRLRKALLRGLRATRPCALLLPLLTGLGAAWAAPVDPTAEYVRAELIAQDDAVAPGASAILGLRLRHAPHWHTYWVVPGDAGLPTQVRWTLAPGYSAGPVEWPVPQRLAVGNLANYGYEGDTLLPVRVHVADSERVGAHARFALHADWLVCNDLCIPGSADLSLRLPVVAAADVHPGVAAAEFAAARQRVPAALVLSQARARIQGNRAELEFALPGNLVPHKLEFFPLEAGRIVAAADQPLAIRGRHAQLTLALSTPVDAAFTALRGVLVADGGPGIAGSAGAWAGQIEVPISRVSGATPALIAADASRPAPLADASAAAPVAAAAAPAVPAPTAPGASATLLALAGAFLGGLILNLMPCVFPVLSLKLIGLVQHRGEEPARMRAHGMAYAVGVVASFLLLAGLLLALRAAGAQIGWGFQLQSPLFIAALIALFFLIGLNLLGTFEFTLGAGLANSRAAQALDGHGLRASFATGILAAVVASPCTAPFMGAALGYAATQSGPLALLVFAVLGAGMAAPYVMLTLAPSLLRRLPRPGAWMERLKQIMAFPMFLTCVWLFWVLGQQIDIDATAWMLLVLVGLGLFAWSLGLAQRGAPRFAWLAAAAALAAVLTAVPLARSAAQPAEHLPQAQAGADWGAWSQEAQRLALVQGRPVFVDFTAAWCITCQANKRLVLHDAHVEQAFLAHGVVRLQADWTRRDEAITRELARFSRSGVPMYVLYDARGGAHLLPEILSTQGLLEELAAL